MEHWNENSLSEDKINGKFTIMSVKTITHACIVQYLTWKLFSQPHVGPLHSESISYIFDEAQVKSLEFINLTVH